MATPLARHPRTRGWDGVLLQGGLLPSVRSPVWLSSVPRLGVPELPVLELLPQAGIEPTPSGRVDLFVRRGVALGRLTAPPTR